MYLKCTSTIFRVKFNSVYKLIDKVYSMGKFSNRFNYIETQIRHPTGTTNACYCNGGDTLALDYSGLVDVEDPPSG